LIEIGRKLAIPVVAKRLAPARRARNRLRKLVRRKVRKRTRR